MNLLEQVKQAGVVGAGGAGFPTHVKLDTQAEFVIANGAECEPLLRVDQQVMAAEAALVVKGLKAAVQHTGAKEGVIFLKEHYHDAVKALEKELKFEKNLRLFLVSSYYPAGDEQQIIYEVTRRVVPPGGLPKDVGCVVSNVSTLADIARAMEGVPVTEKIVTVGGAVQNPVTVKAPVGAPLSALLAAAGGPTEDCTYIIGGPAMGFETEDLSQPVTKTTGGLLAIPKGHALLALKCTDINYKVMQSVCCQCTMCTQMCPRNALGLGTAPHKAMRAIASGADVIGDVAAILTCCDCGLCTYTACNFGLNPANIMKRMKQNLAAKGVRANMAKQSPADPYISDKRLPTGRLMARMGIAEYDVPAPLLAKPLAAKTVRIPVKMHIGAPGVPVVQKGDRVEKGSLIADIPEGAMGAKIHASIPGAVTAVTEKYIEISQEKASAKG